jgi:hypothetical protein
MSKLVKILTFGNQFEAALLDELLNERDIPHIIKSYGDSALSGLWQTQSIWGHIEAPEELRNVITDIYNSMSEPEQVF